MSNKLQASGTIKQIGETQSFGDNGFTKRTFVVSIPDGKDAQWDQPVEFELIKDQCSILDRYSVGDNVTVDFNLRGREYNERHFVNLHAWRLAKTTSSEADTGEVASATPDTAEAVSEDQEIPF